MSLCFLLISVFLVVDQLTAKEEIFSDEICHREATIALFNPVCHPDEDIVMVEAVFGRFNYGKCFNESAKAFNCSQNILAYMHEKCSGNTKCVMDLSKLYVDGINPCGTWSNLHARYQCLAAFNENKDCRHSVVGNQTRGVLKIGSSCGLSGRPWTIVTQPGKTFTIFPIFIGSHKDAVVNSYKLTIGQMTELMTGSKMSILYESGPGRTPSVRSYSSEILIHLNDSRWLLEVKVEGCAELEVPKFARTARNSTHIVVSCKFSQMSWTLTCENETWSGNFGNCSDNVMAENSSTKMSNTNLTLVLSSVFCGIVVMTIAVVCSVINVKRRNEVKRNVELRRRNLQTEFVYRGGDGAVGPGKFDDFDNRFSTTPNHTLWPPQPAHTASSTCKLQQMPPLSQYPPPSLTGSEPLLSKQKQSKQQNQSKEKQQKQLKQEQELKQQQAVNPSLTYVTTLSHPRDGGPHDFNPPGTCQPGCPCFSMQQAYHYFTTQYPHHMYYNHPTPPNDYRTIAKDYSSSYGFFNVPALQGLNYASRPDYRNPYATAISPRHCEDNPPIYNTLENFELRYPAEEVFDTIHETSEVSPLELIPVQPAHPMEMESVYPLNLTLARTKLALSREDILAAERIPWQEMN